ncbi:MAG TPA: energy transducer TonB [Sphingomicrobium sp.]|nr:energy transducer TonB [Sphingomicrobium sp.]
MLRFLTVGVLTGLIASAALAGPNVQQIVTPEDYPEAALEMNAQGTVFFRLTIGADGVVKDCQVTKSSGYSILDTTTCRLIMRHKLRFTPTVDQNGHAVEFTHDDHVDWSLH